MISRRGGRRATADLSTPVAVATCAQDDNCSAGVSNMTRYSDVVISEIFRRGGRDIQAFRSSGRDFDPPGKGLPVGGVDMGTRHLFSKLTFSKLTEET